jgi:hypothetical protein
LANVSLCPGTLTVIGVRRLGVHWTVPQTLEVSGIPPEHMVPWMVWEDTVQPHYVQGARWVRVCWTAIGIRLFPLQPEIIHTLHAVSVDDLVCSHLDGERRCNTLNATC